MIGNWIPSGNDQQRLQGQLRASLLQLQAAQSGLEVLNGILGQMAPASDTTTIETYFGLQAGQGQTLKDTLGSANTTLQGSFVQGLLQRFG